MKILIYGAGVIGSLYAARLQEANQDVSLLARGKRLSQIREHGIVLEDAASGDITTTHVQAVAQLDAQERYDLIIVMVPKNYIKDVLPILALNQTRDVLFMVNNAAGPDEFMLALGRERVLFGFPGAGGVRNDHIVRYRIVSGRQQPTTVGELDGSRTQRLQRIVAVLKHAGFPVAISSRIDAWLKTHVAEICPMVNAIYMAEGDVQRLAQTKESVVLMIRAIREGYRVLQALDIPIEPATRKVFNWIPVPVLTAIMSRVLKSEEMADLVGHAQAARVEMQQLTGEFATLVRSTAIATPALDRLQART
jgi:2-dehydropantoate 2-reductase